MKKCVVLLGWLFVFTSAHAALYQSHSLEDQSLVITTNEGQVTLTVHHETAFEVFYQTDGVKQLPSYAIAGDPKETKISVVESTNKLVLSTGKLSASINKAPLTIKYHQNGELLLEEEVGLFVQDTVRGFRFKLQEQEQLFGGGQRVLGMDRRGQRLPLYNRAHYGYGIRSHQMYYGLPAVMSSNKYALVFDNAASGHMDIGSTEKDVLQFKAVGGRTAYLVVAGSDYPDLIDNFTQLTGRQPLPPRWTFGNFASRFGYHTEQETRDTVDKFINQDFPLDAVVLDLYWFGPDVKGHMGNLDWDRQAFPEPEKMIADFQQLGVNTVVITEPFILTTSNKWADAVKNQALATNHADEPRKFDFFFGNTGLVDVFNEQGQAWFSQFYQRLYGQGVTGWWGDLGEPEVHPADALHNLDGVIATGDEIHNAYGHKWAELVYQTQRKIAPETRPMLMMRSGFVGSQRYGMIPWTGDVSRSWDGLKPQVELSLQMSLFGLAYTHSDLGGFAGGETFDKEMYIRWLQYGVFQPVYRPHAQESIAPEPVFHDRQTQDIIREYIKLRYRLLPYNYSLAYQNSLTGMPLMRPMVFEDPSMFNEANQYMWGDSFLVKPVTDPGMKSIDILLPEGVWFDFWSDRRFEGGKVVSMATELDHLPVLVRGGAIIPMTEVVQSTRDYDSANLTVHYYADKSVSESSYIMYDDDGASANTITKGAYQQIIFDTEHKRGDLKFSVKKLGSYPGAPEQRNITVVIHNWQYKPGSIAVNQQKYRRVKGNLETALKDGTYFWDKKQKLLKIQVKLHEAVTIKIN